MYRIFMLIFLSSGCFSQTLWAQDSIPKSQELQEVRIIQNFDMKYNQQLSRLRRTYPLALEAKRLINEYDQELKRLERRRKKKKYAKSAHKELKSDFNLDIKDLYQSEGKLLIRLIHRETSLTVGDILRKYRGGFQSSLKTKVAKLWGHDVNSKYDPNGIDYVTELVIADIESGVIDDFDFALNHLDRAGYKKGIRAYRDSKKKNRAYIKQYKKAKRKQK
ncbi:MAG: hypothetical protein ACI865_002314 [Flavobacteriaceae bacterium]|jgi:hypothetical protein